MNRIVKEHYPASRLPDDLREGLDPNDVVRVVVETQEPPAARKSGRIQAILADIRRLHDEGKIESVTTEEAVARIRALRDEWP